MSTEDQFDKLISNAMHALAYTLRRQCLRAIEAGYRSPSQVAELIGEPLGVVSYHIRVLHRYGMVKRNGYRRARGAIEHFYKAAPGVIELLDALEALLQEHIGDDT